jgi:seryl-tRNA synthetase
LEKELAKAIVEKVAPQLTEYQIKLLQGHFHLLSTQSKNQVSAVDATEKQVRDFLEAHATRKWLIPTAEVPLTNLVRYNIRDEAELPFRDTAYPRGSRA